MPTVSAIASKIKKAGTETAGLPVASAAGGPLEKLAARHRSRAACGQRQAIGGIGRGIAPRPTHAADAANTTLETSLQFQTRGRPKFK
jgi:hypothetical protein